MNNRHEIIRAAVSQAAQNIEAEYRDTPRIGWELYHCLPAGEPSLVEAVTSELCGIMDADPERFREADDDELRQDAETEAAYLLRVRVLQLVKN